jgi:hypothetical protein
MSFASMFNECQIADVDKLPKVLTTFAKTKNLLLVAMIF